VLQTECGYTPSEIDQMTLLDVQRLARYWRDNPPLTVLVKIIAASLGVKFDKPDKSKYMSADEFKSLVAATGQGRTIIGGN